MTEGAGAEEGTASPREKPEVFKSICGKLIVVDEFLHFISDKMSLFNEFRENMPMFVSRFLDKLPSVQNVY